MTDRFYLALGQLVTAGQDRYGAYQREVEIAECETCGAAVSDTARHDSWHAELASR